MKRQIAIAFATLLVAFTLSATLQAQMVEIHHASIPFSFHVGDRAFPAGDYELRWMGPRLWISSTDGKHAAAVIVIRKDSNDSASRNYLSFNKYGSGEYFLAQMWVTGNNFGYELQKSKLEVEVASRQEQPATYAMVGLNGKK